MTKNLCTPNSNHPTYMRFSHVMVLCIKQKLWCTPSEVYYQVLYYIYPSGGD